MLDRLLLKRNNPAYDNDGNEIENLQNECTGYPSIKRDEVQGWTPFREKINGGDQPENRHNQCNDQQYD